MSNVCVLLLDYVSEAGLEELLLEEDETRLPLDPGKHLLSLELKILDRKRWLVKPVKRLKTMYNIKNKGK